MSEFDEYIVHGEPGQREKADAWQTAIGLQDVDGLKVSPYLVETARRHIEGDVSIDEARVLIKQYYQTKSTHEAFDEEADVASSNIANVILRESNELSNRSMLVSVATPQAQSITPIAPKSQFDTLPSTLSLCYAKNYTFEELSVLSLITDNPKITQTELAKGIKKSTATVKRITSSLAKRGIIIRRNGSRNGWWDIVDAKSLPK